MPINGASGLLVPPGDGTPHALIVLDASPRGIERLLIVTNPDKLHGYA
nr:hypothetical protein [Micromonospora sp. DSM 115978]